MKRTMTKLVLAAALAGGAMIPSVAMAGDRDRYDHRRYDHDDRTDVRFNIGFGGTSYERVPQRVWVEPIYRTVYDRVWIQPVMREDCQRVWVEPVYEVRDVVRYDGWRRRVVRERVCVRPGRWEERRTQVVVTPGHWQNVPRQELVSAGHWEYRPGYVRDNRPSWGFSFGYRD